MEHLEGKQSILAALEARQRRFDVILIRHGTHEEKIRDVLDRAAAMGVPIRYVDSRELDAMSHGATHGGVLAVVSAKPRVTFEELAARLDSLSEPPLLLLLEGVEDSRNLGFTIRSAEALGAHAVLIKKHLWDFDAVEIARPSSGAYERMALVQVDDVKPLISLQQRGVRLLGCLAGVTRTLYQENLAGPCMLAIGGEKRGLSGATRSICDGFLTIPTVAGAASLSVSHAAAIILGEARRQRIAS
ncbi:MAG TPA: RNA methyltransferase [Humisphaera sp.]|jgi:23S rRNA (guanosine2251-2'-O)-methyltransferase|nr:RNA methyltransferase [Humisphaera sp.]